MSFQGNDDKERIQAATDIVRLIGEHVQLRPKGRELAGLCPFHDDKSPSMFVSPAKQIYKCFSCGAGGDCFTFAMEYHKLDFVEAMKFLADREGIELTPWKPGAGGGSGAKSAGLGDSGSGSSFSDLPPRKRLLTANEQALQFYRKKLADPEVGRAARAYLEERGVSDTMVEQFKLGYAPDAWDALTTAVAKHGLDIPAFGRAGHIAKRGQSDPDAVITDAADCYDKMRHRLIFPICDDMGRPIAFGGRILPDPVVTAPKDGQDGGPKYLNSPESAVFNKSATLYGLDVAKKPIIDSKQAVIVEGYTDVIACHQHGVCNVVAALGTAFTHQHAARLRRFCETVVLVFDGDAAGYKAADRAVEVLMTGEIDVAIAILPAGEDPDTLLKQEDGLDRWTALVDGAADAMSYLLSRLNEELNKAGSITGRQSVSTEFLTRLARHGLLAMSPVRRALVLGRVGQLMHMPESAVLAEVKRLAPRASAPVTQPVPDESMVPESAYDDENSGYQEVAQSDSRSTLRADLLAERQLIGCLLRDNHLFEHTLPDGTDFCEAVMAGELSPGHRLVYHMIHDRLSEGRAVSLVGLLGDLAEQGLDAERRAVTQADTELDQVLRDRDERLAAVFESAALALYQGRAKRAYAESRQQLAQDMGGAGSALDKAAQAQRLLEERRAHGSPGRIARTRS